VNKPQTIEGVWHIHGEDKPANIGILNYDPEKGFELSIQIPRSRSTDEAFIAMLTGADDDEISNVIHGTNKNASPVTLFGCSLREFSKGAGMDNYRVHVSAAILNHHVATWESAQYPAAGVKFNLLTRWLNQKFEIYDKQRVTEAINRKSFLFEFQLHDELEFIVSPEARIKIQSFPHPSHTPAELTIKQVHTLYFLFTKPMPAQKLFEDFVMVFLRLLHLLTGERIFAEQITLHDRDPFIPNTAEHLKSYELLLTNTGVNEAKNDVHAGHMVVSYEAIASNFQDILKKWFECHERLEPVLDLYYAVITNLVLTDKSRFLYMAQAMEVYHARSGFNGTVQTKECFRKRRDNILENVSDVEKEWLKEKLHYANQKTLADRLTEILELHRDEVRQLTFNIIDFASKVRHSRNYYTHYDQELWDSGKVADGLELRRIAYALIFLLEICLLKELGIKGEPIAEVLDRYSKIEWADLKSETIQPVK
jgi:hypothetical protein